MTEDEAMKLATKLTMRLYDLASDVYGMDWAGIQPGTLKTPFVQTQIKMITDLYMLLLKQGLTPEQIKAELVNHYEEIKAKEGQ